MLDNNRTPPRSAEAQPLTPPYLHSLGDDEVAALRSIYNIARNRRSDYFQLQDFIGNGGDIRNFLKDSSSRPSYKLLSQLYNYAITTLRSRSVDNPVLKELIDDLIDVGIKSGRYDRDFNVYMNGVIEGRDITSYNVDYDEQKLFIGYRYLTASDRIIRFYISIFNDKLVNRTRYVAYTKLGTVERKTRGFAYLSRGTVSLSGFLNRNLGCEFMSFRSVADDHLKSGIVITTVRGTMPTAKQFALIDADRTVYSRHMSNDLINDKKQLREKMKLVDYEECKPDFLDNADFSTIFTLFKKEEVVDILDGMEGERGQ